jgi:hypothetical protein
MTLATCLGGRIIKVRVPLDDSGTVDAERVVVRPPFTTARIGELAAAIPNVSKGRRIVVLTFSILKHHSDR